MAVVGGIEESSKAEPEPSDASRSVFLSYASADAVTAQAVCQFLESHGAPCWMAPRDVRPGAQYADAIVRAINDSAALVVVLSAAAVASSHVAREVERAGSKQKPLIAFRMDAAPLSPALEYFLSDSQWIDVAALGMPAALEKLLEAVGQGRVGSASAAGAAFTPTAAVPHGRSGRVVLAGVGLVIVGVSVAMGVHFWSTRHRALQPTAVAEAGAGGASKAVSDKSIAVLPFVDLSEKHDQEYFADGMSEEILDLLTKIPGLQVIGRTSSFQFKGKNEDLRTIGEKLNAAYVLEGSVRKAGNQVRITAQLINAKTGTHEWSETYDRPIGDVLKLQDAIAVAVVREMQLTVAGADLGSRSTLRNADAYDLMLRGRHASDRWDKEGLDEAVALFKQALSRDPTYAQASAELAFAYYKQGVEQFIGPRIVFEQARQAANAALLLDPKTTLAHYVLGKIHIVYDWDWAAAEREFEEVAKLVPGSPDAPNGEARLSLALGHWDHALEKVKVGLIQDPSDPNSFQALAAIQLGRAHLSDAEAAMRKALDIRPTYGWGHYYLGLILLARGDYQAALGEMKQETNDFGQQAGLAMAYHALGRKPESDAALLRMLREQATENAFEIAHVYAFLGQQDEARHWLERAYIQKDPGLVNFKFELADNGLAAHPAYKEFLRKMNLPE
jgi:TolB-like protein